MVSVMFLINTSFRNENGEKTEKGEKKTPKKAKRKEDKTKCYHLPTHLNFEKNG